MKSLLRSDRKYHIFLGGRDLSKAQTATKSVVEEFQSASTVEALQVDVESDESIAAALKTVSAKHDRIDVLINNAGWSSLARSCGRTLRLTQLFQARALMHTFKRDACRREKRGIEAGTST